jgi:hypothetical protein
MHLLRWLRNTLEEFQYFYTDATRDQRSFIRLLAYTNLIVLAGAVFVFYVGKEIRLEEKRKQSLSYSQQLDSLNSVQQSLNNLIDFVDLQKRKLRESEDVVDTLKAEQEKLEPVVATNRQVIEAILDLQSRKAQADVWKERGIGFLSGIIASVIASFLFAFFSRRKKNTTAASPAASP